MKLRVTAVVASGLTVVAAALLGWLFVAARHVPDFYRQALNVENARLQEHSDRLVETAAALVSNVRQEGRWQAMFTAEQVNGWLAVDATRNFPELLPAGVAEPRVAIEAGRLKLACRYLGGPVETVLSLDGEVYLEEPNVLSIRVHRARAGSLPAPLGRVLHAISQAALDANLQLNWLQAGGDPVAVIRWPTPRDERQNFYHLETLELHDGQIYLAGRTTKGPSEGAPEKSPEPLASRPAEDAKKR